MTRDITDRPKRELTRAGCRRAVGALAACALMMMPTGATAATVTVIHDPAPPADEVVEFRPAPGERNVLTVSGRRERAPGALTRTEVWQIQDSGAVLTAVAPCEALDPHTVTCRLQMREDSDIGNQARFDLGDLDDVAQATQQTAMELPTIDGETGNDRLVGESGFVHLIGGDGDDEIRASDRRHGGRLDGGRGDDRLYGNSEAFLVGGGGRDAMYGAWFARDGDIEGARGAAGRLRRAGVRFRSPSPITSTEARYPKPSAGQPFSNWVGDDLTQARAELHAPLR